MRTTTTRAHAFLQLRLRLLGLIAAGGWVVAAATMFGFIGSWHWLLDLCSHFRLQYASALLIAAPLLARRHPRQALLFAALLLVNAALLIPLYVPSESPTTSRDKTWRVMLINVNTHAGNPARVAASIAAQQPDVLALVEVSDAWMTALAPALTNFSERLVDPRDDNFGLALLSRFPWTNAALRLIGDAGAPTLHATVLTPQGPVTCIVTHPVPPTGAQYTAWRNDQLARLPELVHAADAPVLLVGDLNTTPWNHTFRKLLRASGLRDSSRGSGYQATWPSHNPLLRIPLDHCLHAPELTITARTIGPHVGSDHFPLLVDCQLQKK